jgi:competence ComEA-like helix-hairpin-helix protein
MFYLSRSEQVALFLLVALLLAGAGVVTYQRGAQVSRARSPEPLFVEAKSAPASPVASGQQEAGARPAAAPPESVVTTRTPGHTDPAPRAKAGKRADRISLNAATSEDLEALPGIGPVLARRILQYREQRKRENGRGFTSVDELLNVSGIGPKRLAAVRDCVVP